MPIQLSSATKRRIDALFPDEQRAEVARLLCDEGGNNLPLCDSDDEFQLERIRFAALKLSQGSVQKLHEAIGLAKVDWRDLLVDADFADDTNAHKRWFPNE